MCILPRVGLALRYRQYRTLLTGAQYLHAVAAMVGGMAAARKMLVDQVMLSGVSI
jgi:hypothetical protein